MTITETLTAKIHEAVAEHFQAAASLSRYLYEHPEISGCEFESSKKIAALLGERGFDVEYPFCGIETAFRATLELGAPDSGASGTPAPFCIIMVEYDALPELGHGCGHNLHGALSVLAALALKEILTTNHTNRTNNTNEDEEKINNEDCCFFGKIIVIGTPAEETIGAKIKMADAGVFDGASLAIMMHSIGGGIARPNFDLQALRRYNVSFTGKSAHAAISPWEGHSAQTALRKFLDLLDARRECFTSDIRFSAIITESGKAVNIIPEHASALVEFRAATNARLDLLDETVKKCAQGAALALDCKTQFSKTDDDYANMVRVPALEDEAEKLFRTHGFECAPVLPPAGSSDVGNVSHRCPALQPFIPITSQNFALHTKEFAASTQSETALDAMRRGAEIIAALCAKVLCEAEFREAIHKEWEAARL
jgi:metal-dependent amidase/aminoacylase/carboxypeptidase family protein